MTNATPAPPGAKILTLTNGKPVLVDADDYAWLSKWKWWQTTDGYAYRRHGNARAAKWNWTEQHILMHRAIMNPPDGKLIDHINRNKLDNRRRNLRVVDQSVNTHNTDLWSTNTSGYKGVSWNARRQRWRAYIGVGMQRIELGYHRKIEDAIAARAAAEQRYAEECGFSCPAR